MNNLMSTQSVNKQTETLVAEIDSDDDHLLIMEPPKKKPRTYNKSSTSTQKQSHLSQDFSEDMTSAFKMLNEALKQKLFNSTKNDDCDLYGKLLASKLRKLGDIERQQIMYEIDGIFIKRLNGVSQVEVSGDDDEVCVKEERDIFVIEDVVRQ